MKRRLERAFRIVRLIAGGICLGLAIHWTIETIRRRRPTVSIVGFDEGRPTGIRIAPLSVAEAEAARAVEASFFAGAIDWSKGQAAAAADRQA